jgi:Tfp pilus assembly protein PilN
MKYEVNLLPRELQPKPPPSGTRLVLLIVVTMLISGLLGGYAAFLLDYQAKQQLRETLQQQLLTVQVGEKKIKEIKDERLALEQTAAKQREILTQDRQWFIVLEEINQCVPPTTWLTSIKLTPLKQEKQDKAPPVVLLSGTSADLTNIGGLLQNLQQLPHFKQVSLDWAKETVPLNGLPVLNFQITAQLAGDDDE